ncbi:hypothetical protein ACJX0J_036657 [Zea mays]
MLSLELFNYPALLDTIFALLHMLTAWFSITSCGDARPFVEEAVLQVSDWGFNLSNIQMQKKEAQRFFELIKVGGISGPNPYMAGFMTDLCLFGHTVRHS